MPSCPHSLFIPSTVTGHWQPQTPFNLNLWWPFLLPISEKPFHAAFCKVTLEGPTYESLLLQNISMNSTGFAWIKQKEWDFGDILCYVLLSSRSAVSFIIINRLSDATHILFSLPLIFEILVRPISRKETPSLKYSNHMIVLLFSPSHPLPVHSSADLQVFFICHWTPPNTRPLGKHCENAQSVLVSTRTNWNCTITITH